MDFAVGQVAIKSLFLQPPEGARACSMVNQGNLTFKRYLNLGIAKLKKYALKKKIDGSLRNIYIRQHLNNVGLLNQKKERFNWSDFGKDLFNKGFILICESRIE